MKIALYYRHIDEADRAAYEALTATLRDRGIDTVTVSDGNTLDGCDYLFSIGGDGTLLSSVQFIHSSTPESFPPVLGINFGHLGFLTTVGRENLHSMVDELLAGHFSLEERTLISVVRGQRSAVSGATQDNALNEVFVHRTEEASMLRTQVYVDGQYVATYAGDGLIVATPTGSTAYSLSCGGPILTPDSRCLVITPISAHTLTLRPIIVPDNAVIRLHVCDPGFLGIDSRRSTLDSDCDLTLRRAPFTIRLIRMNTQNFFSAIRDKLMWGSEVRK